MALASRTPSRSRAPAATPSTEPTERYVALYDRAACTAALRAVPGLTIVSARHAPMFEVNATAQAARRVNRLRVWTASVPQLLFEVPSPRPGFPMGPVAAPKRSSRAAQATTGTPPARITARRMRAAG